MFTSLYYIRLSVHEPCYKSGQKIVQTIFIRKCLHLRYRWLIPENFWILTHSRFCTIAGVVVQAPSTISSTDIRRELHRLPVYHHISYKLSLLTWKALHTAEPS